jgi:hypothetical protein
MWQSKSASPTKDMAFNHTVVGVTPVALGNTAVKFVRGLLLRAPGHDDVTPNTGVIFIGDRNVTVATGLALIPGASIELPVDDSSLIYVVSTHADQDLAWLAV